VSDRLLLVAFDADDAIQARGLAQATGLPYDLLLIKGEAPAVGAQGVRTFGLPDAPPADFLAHALRGLVEGYSHVAMVSAMRSKDVLARLAGLTDAAMVTDVLVWNGPLSFVRPMLAGSVLATVEVAAGPVYFTFRPAGFGPGEERANGATEAVKPAFAGKTRRVSQSSRGGGRPDLAQAKVVVSGGRPLGDAETFERVVGGLADALGGAVGATRAAVDSGIAANELQVGQTGKIVAPELYIAAGISGSTQHMAGIKDSKVIVAINTDADAPIFDIADFGLVADLFEALPAIQAKLKQ
jgi:electron transfer flavoprotein alpha subunit